MAGQKHLRDDAAGGSTGSRPAPAAGTERARPAVTPTDHAVARSCGMHAQGLRARADAPTSHRATPGQR